MCVLSNEIKFHFYVIHRQATIEKTNKPTNRRLARGTNANDYITSTEGGGHELHRSAITNLWQGFSGCTTKCEAALKSLIPMQSLHVCSAKTLGKDGGPISSCAKIKCVSRKTFFLLHKNYNLVVLTFQCNFFFISFVQCHGNLPSLS